jgi:hypothetical protein
VVYAVVVPAVMRLLGDLNWWVPSPLARLQRPLAMRELTTREDKPEAA